MGLAIEGEVAERSEERKKGVERSEETKRERIGRGGGRAKRGDKRDKRGFVGSEGSFQEPERSRRSEPGTGVGDWRMGDLGTYHCVSVSVPLASTGIALSRRPLRKRRGVSWAQVFASHQSTRWGCRDDRAALGLCRFIIGIVVRWVAY